MPSDLPPNRPTDPASPMQGHEAGTSTPATSDITGGAAGREQADALNADLLRFSGTGGGGQQKRRGISNSFAWSMMIAVAIIVAVLIRQGPALVEPPPRVLAGVPAANRAAPAIASAPAPDEELIRAYGSGTMSTAGREAQRVGQAAALAALCGLRSSGWVSKVRDGLAKEMAERFPTFDNDRQAAAKMHAHLAAHYDSGRAGANRAIAEQGQESVCANIRYSPDFGVATRIANQ